MRNMIDFHAHVLPGLDDGSKDVFTSVKMLEMLFLQNVKNVIATPHFDANNSSVFEFLEKRKSSYNELLSVLPKNSPDVLLGAEVMYYEGINRLDSIRELCVEKSKLLLIEMPFLKWTESVLREIHELTCSKDIIVVIAHLERYLQFQTADILDRLRDSGVLMQLNASYFTRFFSKNKACSMLIDRKAHFIGSDCHDLEKRAPNIEKAFQVIERKFGKGFIDSYCGYINSFFEFD